MLSCCATTGIPDYTGNVFPYPAALDVYPSPNELRIITYGDEKLSILRRNQVFATSQAGVMQPGMVPKYYVYDCVVALLYLHLNLEVTI